MLRFFLAVLLTLVVLGTAIYVGGLSTERKPAPWHLTNNEAKR
jgi:hypothetical protein